MKQILQCPFCGYTLPKILEPTNKKPVRCRVCSKGYLVKVVIDSKNT